MRLSGGIFQDFCCWATQVHLRAVIQEQKPKSTSRALNKQLQNVWIHLFPSLSWSNKVSLSTLPFVSSLNNMNDMLNFRVCPHKDKSFHKIWENDWKKPGDEEAELLIELRVSGVLDNPSRVLLRSNKKKLLRSNKKLLRSNIFLQPGGWVSIFTFGSLEGRRLILTEMFAVWLR